MVLTQSLSYYNQRTLNQRMHAAWLQLNADIFAIIENGTCSLNLMGVPFSINDREIDGFQSFSKNAQNLMVGGSYLIKKGSLYGGLLYIQNLTLQASPFPGQRDNNSSYVRYFTFLKIQTLKQAPTAPILSANLDSNLIFREARIPVQVVMDVSQGMIILQCSGISQSVLSRSLRSPPNYGKYYPATTQQK
jgi:hypothetical protein